MPPRRTTRAKPAAVEEEAVRSEPVEAEESSPPKKATRTTRTTRAKKTVVEPDSEEEDGGDAAAPAKAKKDRQTALSVKNENMDQEGASLTRVSRGKKASGKTSRDSKTAQVSLKAEDDENEEPAATSISAGTRQRKISANSRSSNGLRSPEPEADIDLPVSFRKASARLSLRRSASPSKKPCDGSVPAEDSASQLTRTPTKRFVVMEEPATPTMNGSERSGQGMSSNHLHPFKTPKRAVSTVDDGEPDLTALITPAKSIGAITPGRNTMRMAAKPEPPKKRLVIHKMVLHNFKSYAGRQEIGPFHKSFSAIVGPNGSGKSNTIDALLFVFGYRANKMRQGKLGELIHNSANYQNLESCSVEIWFREIVDLPGPDNFLVVPDSQLVVARIAFKNNSSKYTINGNNSSFTEVTTLLRQRGIDLDHKRFLILQGEVESIAQMKPKAPNEHEDGLLEYLEDIIGTSKYKAPIEQAQVDVDTFNEDRADKLNRLRIIEKEKSSLEAKKREAEDFLRDANNLTRKKSLLWQFHMYTLTCTIDLTNKAIGDLEKQLEEETEKNAGNLAAISDIQKAYDEKVEAAEEVKKHVQALQKDLKKLEKEEVALSEKRKLLVSKQKKLTKTLTEDGHAKSEALTWVQNHSEDISKTRKSLDELEKKLVKEEKELEEIRDSLKDKTDEFTSKIEEKQLELQPWSAKINDRQSALAVAEKEKALLIGKASSVQTALDEAVAALQKLIDDETAKTSEYRDLQEQKSSEEAQIKTLSKKLSSYDAQSESLRSRVTVARQKLDEARSSAAAGKSENAVLSALNKLKAQGRLKGFHGRLGDLGVIDDKYDVAITTACGSLNNLVVDTVEQGQACIEYLRKGNIGRASIMVLEKLPARDLGQIETPENAPRLFDLIRPRDPKFAPAFFKAVMNTLVANDLQQAQRIGYGKRRWRVVTLGGQVIDPSGTMSGGGAKIQRGGMSSNYESEGVSPEALARLEQECTIAEQELQRFVVERKALEADHGELKKSIPKLEIALEKLEMELRTSEKRKGDAKGRVQDLRAQAKPNAGDEKRIDALDIEIKAVSSELEKLRAKSSIIETEIKNLQDKILEVGGVKLRAVQSRVSNTRSQIQMANEAITRAEVAMAKNERDAEKLKKTIEANNLRAEELASELQSVEADLAGSTNDRELIEEKVKEAVEAMETVQDTLADAKAELDEKAAGINAFRAMQMDIKQRLEDNARVIKESNTKLKHWSTRHRELELVAIDDDDEDADAAVDNGEAATSSDDARSKRATADQATELPEYSVDDLRAVNRDVLNAEIAQLEEEIGKAKPNLNVLAEYRKRESEYLERGKDLDSTTAARDQAKKRYDDLRKARLDEFMTGFSAISSKLKEMYQMITLGGNAELELVDSMDPFSEGIIFSVMPPKKSWKNISNLSGGEKTLSSLALVFALHVFKPTPLYFMDEIDAALDFRNVSIIANYIKSKTEAAQFIIISLRNDMFELAHRLVGIYKTSNCTKTIAIDNKDLSLQGLKKSLQAQGTVQKASQAPASAMNLGLMTPMPMKRPSVTF